MSIFSLITFDTEYWERNLMRKRREIYFENAFKWIWSLIGSLRARTWCLCALRIGVCKDIRRKIAAEIYLERSSIPRDDLVNVVAPLFGVTIPEEFSNYTESFESTCKRNVVMSILGSNL